jgi:hypothetical protein
VQRENDGRISAWLIPIADGLERDGIGQAVAGGFPLRLTSPIVHLSIAVPGCAAGWVLGTVLVRERLNEGEVMRLGSTMFTLIRVGDGTVSYPDSWVITTSPKGTVCAIRLG